MKKNGFAQFFVPLLALLGALVFFGCSDGGDDDPPPVSVAYTAKTADDRLVRLTLTGEDRGTYTLYVDDLLVSSGEFSAADGTLSFTSAGGKSFTAAAGGATPPVFAGNIPLDTEDSLEPPAFVNAEIFEVPVYSPDGTPFEGNVEIYGWISGLDDLPGYKSLGQMGEIAGGKLTLNLRTLTTVELYPQDDIYCGTLYFTNGSSDSSNAVGLSFQRPGVKEGLTPYYFSEDTVLDGFTLEKGWNFMRQGWGNRWEIHPLRWFAGNGYRWVYNPDPLPGTWDGSWDGGDRESPITFFTNGHFSWEDDREGTFTKTAHTITFTWEGSSATQEYMICGDILFLKQSDDQSRGPYLRQ